jgi:hypothetical protein
VYLCGNQFQLPSGLRRRSAAAHLVRLWVQITPGAWMYTVANVVCCRYRSLRRADHSSRGILPTVVCFVFDLKTSSTPWPWPALALNATAGREGWKCMRLFTAPVWNSKEFLGQSGAPMKWRKEVSVYKPVWPHYQTPHFPQIPGISVWLAVKFIRSCVTKFIWYRASYC